MAQSLSNPYSAQEDGSVHSWSDLSTYGKTQFITTGIDALSNIFTSMTLGKSNNFVARVKAEIEEKNARLEALKANQALARSNQQISMLTMRYGQTKSAQKVAFAANGVKASNGSYQEVLATTDLYKKLDVDTAYANGLNAAFGYLNKATAYRMSAVHERSKIASVSSIGADSLMTGVAKLGKVAVEATKYNRE